MSAKCGVKESPASVPNGIDTNNGMIPDTVEPRKVEECESRGIPPQRTESRSRGAIEDIHPEIRGEDIATEHVIDVPVDVRGFFQVQLSGITCVQTKEVVFEARRFRGADLKQCANKKDNRQA